MLNKNNVAHFLVCELMWKRSFQVLMSLNWLGLTPTVHPSQPSSPSDRKKKKQPTSPFSSSPAFFVSAAPCQAGVRVLNEGKCSIDGFHRWSVEIGRIGRSHRPFLGIQQKPPNKSTKIPKITKGKCHLSFTLESMREYHSCLAPPVFQPRGHFSLCKRAASNPKMVTCPFVHFLLNEKKLSDIGDCSGITLWHIPIKYLETVSFWGERVAGLKDFRELCIIFLILCKQSCSLIWRSNFEHK